MVELQVLGEPTNRTRVRVRGMVEGRVRNRTRVRLRVMVELHCTRQGQKYDSGEDACSGVLVEWGAGVNPGAEIELGNGRVM